MYTHVFLRFSFGISNLPSIQCSNVTFFFYLIEAIFVCRPLLGGYKVVHRCILSLLVGLLHFLCCLNAHAEKESDKDAGREREREIVCTPKTIPSKFGKGIKITMG